MQSNQSRIVLLTTLAVMLVVAFAGASSLVAAQPQLAEPEPGDGCGEGGTFETHASGEFNRGANEVDSYHVAEETSVRINSEENRIIYRVFDADCDFVDNGYCFFLPINTNPCSPLGVLANQEFGQTTTVPADGYLVLELHHWDDTASYRVTLNPADI